MAVVTHTLTAGINPPTNVSFAFGITSGAGLASCVAQLTFDDGTNQYVIKGSISQIQQILAAASQASNTAGGVTSS